MKDISGLNELRKHYDKEEIAKSYEKLRFTSLAGEIEHLLEINLINSIIKKEQPKLVLEIATGPGRLTKDIKLFSKGIGIDSSKNMLNLAKKNVSPNWKFIKSDIMKMPFKNNNFDLALSFKLIMHFEYKERMKSYKEIKRVLKKDSLFVFDMGNKQYNKPSLTKTLLNFYRLFSNKKENALLPRIHNTLITKEELIKELKDNKFSIVKIYGLHYYTNLVLFLLALSKRIKLLSSLIKGYIIRLEIKNQKHLEKYGSFIIIAKNEK